MTSSGLSRPAIQSSSGKCYQHTLAIWTVASQRTQRTPRRTRELNRLLKIKSHACATTGTTQHWSTQATQVNSSVSRQSSSTVSSSNLATKIEMNWWRLGLAQRKNSKSVWSMRLRTRMSSCWAIFWKKSSLIQNWQHVLKTKTKMARLWCMSWRSRVIRQRSICLVVSWTNQLTSPTPLVTLPYMLQSKSTTLPQWGISFLLAQIFKPRIRLEWLLFTLLPFQATWDQQRTCSWGVLIAMHQPFHTTENRSIWSEISQLCPMIKTKQIRRNLSPSWVILGTLEACLAECYHTWRSSEITKQCGCSSHFLFTSFSPRWWSYSRTLMRGTSCFQQL